MAQTLHEASEGSSKSSSQMENEKDNKNNNKKNNTFIKIKKAPSLRVYYSVRNRMIFEKNNLIDNKLIYNLNKLVFTCLLFCFCFGNKNFKVFKKAVRHANTNNFMRF